MPLMRCSDLSQVRAFCSDQPIRYRHLLHALNPPCPEWDAALGTAGDEPAAFYVDTPTRPALVACLRGGTLQIEGEVAKGQREALIAWCRQLAPQRVFTTSSAQQHLLSDAFGLALEQWEQDGQYTAAQDGFSPRLTRPVRRLTAADRRRWERFVARHADEPIMTLGIRDFDLMARGLPITLYVTESEQVSEITGVLTVVPYTYSCDEIAMVFVEPEYRRRGNANSMLSEATYNILRRGHLPGYSADHNRPELISMLTAVGYVFITLTWYAQVG